jgi:ribonuclease VapC
VSSFVVDTSALIAVVKAERGWQAARDALVQSLVSAVIMAETLSKLANLGFEIDVTERLFREAGVEVASVTDADVRVVASLHGLAKQSVSMADRFCLALGMTSGLPIVTADRAWASLGLPVEVRLFR